MPDLSDTFDELMARFDRSMIIVTTVGADGERAGCLVGFATQCSIDPSRFLVCLSVTNRTFAIAQEADLLAVHAIPSTERALAELFGSETGDHVDKFEQCAWHPGVGGVPLLDACPDRFVGRILDRHDLGDHRGHLLQPVAVDVAGDPGTFVSLQDVADLDPGHAP